MIRWSVGTNNVYKEATVYREEGPWWGFFIEKSLELLCDLLWWAHKVPLPDVTICKDCLSGDKFMEENEVVTLKNYYGSLYNLFQLKVHDPIYQWCWSKCTITGATMDIDEVPREWIPWEEQDEDTLFQDLKADKLYRSFLNARLEKQVIEDEMNILKKQTIERVLGR